MNLEIIPYQSSLVNAFGISEERERALALMMEEVFRQRFNHDSFADILNKIAFWCNTNEELVWCTVTHTQYLIVKGILPIK